MSTIIIISHSPSTSSEMPSLQLPDGMTNAQAAALLRQAANNLEVDDNEDRA